MKNMDPKYIIELTLKLFITCVVVAGLLYLVLAFALPYGTVQQHGEEEEPFAGFGQPTGGPADYTPEAPPFDISEAQDVEIDGQE